MARPHISMALQHLRFSVLVAGVVLGLCIFGQTMVWAFVHFTEVRITEVAPVETEGPLEVVQSPGQQAGDESEGEPAVKPGLLTGAKIANSRPKASMQASEPADPNLVPSAGDRMLERAAGIVGTFGVLGAVLLSIFMLQAVVIAGGGSVPGVEKAVTACTWTLVISMLALPLHTWLPSVPFPGVFVSYDEMLSASEAYRSNAAGAPGLVGFWGMHLLLPMLMLVGLVIVILRFRAGIEEGVIVTNASQLDEKLEREIRSMKLGKLATPRAVGALNAAIGDRPEPVAPPPPAPAPTPPSRRPMTQSGAGTVEGTPPMSRPV